jgi:hypothetical protein
MAYRLQRSVHLIAWPETENKNSDIARMLNGPYNFT